MEQGRKLVEQDEVAFIFSPLGTASNAAIRCYNVKKVPDAFIVSGASRFAVAKDYPFTTTALVGYETEAKVYATYIRESLSNCRRKSQHRPITGMPIQSKEFAHRL